MLELPLVRERSSSETRSLSWQPCHSAYFDSLEGQTVWYLKWRGNALIAIPWVVRFGVRTAFATTSTMNSSSKLIRGLVVDFACVLPFLSSVEAHGYTTISRSILCKQGNNFACGSIVYEPQSLEATKGFPAAGPADGSLASAAVDRFATLDEQTAYRWVKTSVQAGPWDFTWVFTANHATTGYEYFITQPDWDPEAPLTRSQFDLIPFCTVPRGGVQPPLSGDTHACTLPPRTGYHIILGVWTIDDTAMAFYNVMDVQYGGTNPPPPTAPSPTLPPTLPTSTLPPPTISSSPPPPTNDNELCSLGLPLEAVEDCTAFVHCQNRAAVSSPVACPAGLLFDNAGQRCDWANNVVCGSDSNPPTTTTVCAAGQSLAAIEDCAGFVHCLDGAPVQNSQTYCPTGLLFNENILACDYPNNVNCN